MVETRFVVTASSIRRRSAAWTILLDRTGSRAAVAVALQRACRSGLAGDLCRDAAHAGGVEGTDQQDRPQRRAWYCADDAGWALPSGSCEDVTQSETADAADASQAAAVESDRHRQ